MADPALATLDNATARRLFLDRHGLLRRPAGPGKGDDLAQVIDQLGFVQVDSINTLARAHDHILFARRPAYRPRALELLIERDRRMFENWTHDAAVIPMGFYPHWKHRFDRRRAKLVDGWSQRTGTDMATEAARVKDIIARDGAQTTRTIDAGRPQNGGGWWDWAPSKAAMEVLWQTGELAICHRQNFSKAYDLAERVIPADAREAQIPRDASINWAAMGALDRLGFATPTELARFWDLFSIAEMSDWAQSARRDTRVAEVAVIGRDKAPRISLMRPTWEEDIANLPAPLPRLRILSPFDPVIRDRARLSRLFGFDYRIEVFTPAAKRVYGYYVFPILEGIRFTGRIDLKANRATATLHIQGYWPEPGVKLGQGRMAALAAELERLMRFAGLAHLTIDPGPKTELLRAAPARLALG